jgi:hypothetical protein
MSMEWEQRLGVGLVTTAVVIATLYRERRRPGVRLLGLVAISIIALAVMYRGGVTPWSLVFRAVPGANAIRAVSRIGILLLLPAAVALALFVERGGRWRVALAALALLEQGQRLVSYDKQATRAQMLALARQVPASCPAFFYSPVGSARPNFETQLDAMWAALESGRPTVNGYSSNFPPGWDLLQHNIAAEADRARLSAALEAWAKSRGIDPASLCWLRLPDSPSGG